MSTKEIEAIEEVMLEEDVSIESEMWQDLKDEQSAHLRDALETIKSWHE